MAFKFNIFTSNFDLVEGESPFWLDPVPTRGDLPSGVADGAAINVLDEESIFVYDLVTDEWYNTRLSLTQFDAATNPEGISIETVQTANVNDFRINLHPASSTTPGGVSTGAQNFAGNKTFDNDVTITGDLTVNGTTTTVNSTTLDVTDANITINNNGDQATADLNDAGLTIEMSDATDVVFGYDSTLTSRMKLGDLGDEREVVTVSHSQTITNKNLKDTSNLLSGASADNFIRETGNQSNFLIPDSASDDTFVLEDFAQSLTNKDLKSATNLLTGASADSLMRETGNQQSVTIPDTASPDNFVLESFAQTLSNKTIDNSNDITVQDSNLTIQDNVDNTKQAQLQLDQISTATTRTYTLPDADDTLVVEAAAQTITNKTMDADDNTFSNFRHGDEVDNPSSGVHGVTGDIVGTTDAQTLTNKTIDADSNTITNIDDNEIKALAGIDATKIADGSVNNTEFQYISTLTSNAQDQIDGKADRNLGNLTSPTAINQNLQFADAFRSVGNSATPALNLYSQNIQPGVGNTLLVRTDDNAVADASPTQVLTVKSGNKSAGTGNSGAVSITSGSSAGGNSGNVIVQTGSAAGTRGNVILDGEQVDVQTSKIVNVIDPTNNQDAATKKYVDDNTTFVVGDLDQVSFSITNNQAVFADVTGVAFANGVTRSAELHYSVNIDADTDLYESGQIQLIQKGASWEISQGSIVGDNSQILFDITPAGQLQYQSADYTGFVSGTLKVRAITTSV